VVYFWDRYAGFDGCNWFLGVYSATPEGELRMESPSRTAYPNQCGSAELNEQSARYVASLLSTIQYQREGEQLITYAAQDQRLLTYNPAKPVPMLGTEWRLELWWRADLRLFDAVVPGVMTTLTFGEGGQASGSGGCNNYTVSYDGDVQTEKAIGATNTYTDLPALTFGPVAAQKMTCADPEGIMEQEQGYFTTLGSVAYYFKLGGMLLMLDAEGAPLLMFSAPS
jgi:heat shock protein HslJ